MATNQQDARRASNWAFATLLQAEAKATLELLAGSEGSEASVRNLDPRLEDYLSRETLEIAELIGQATGVSPSTEVVQFRYFPDSAARGREFFEGLAAPAEDGFSASAFRGLAADSLKEHRDILRGLDSKNLTFVTYFGHDLGSLARSYVLGVRPVAFGKGSAALNELFRQRGFGFVIKKTGLDEDMAAEKAAYEAFRRDSRIRTAAAYLGSFGSATILSLIREMRFAEFAEKAEKYRNANPGSREGVRSFLLATKHAHLRQVALAHLALKGSPHQEKAYEGLKLDSASKYLGINSPDGDDNQFNAAIEEVEKLFGNGEFAPRIDPSKNNAWVSRSLSLDDAVSSYSKGEASDLLKLATDSLSISDFKRTRGLYPVFDDAIEVHLNTESPDPAAILDTCRVFNALRKFYSGSPAPEAEPGFLNRLNAWDSCTGSAKIEKQNELIAKYKVDPAALPPEDEVRILALAGTRLLRWAQKIKAEKGDCLALADQTMLNRDTEKYLAKASESFRIAARKSSGVQQGGSAGMGIKQALEYVAGKIGGIRP